jgi:hypothetical protein
MIQRLTIEDAIHAFCADARWQDQPSQYAVIMQTQQRCEVEAWPYLLAYGRRYLAFIDHQGLRIRFRTAARVGLYAADKLYLVGGSHFESALILDCADMDEITEQLLKQHDKELCSNSRWCCNSLKREVFFKLVS